MIQDIDLVSLLFDFNLNDVDVRIIFRSMLFYSCRTHGLQLKKNIRTVSVYINKGAVATRCRFMPLFNSENKKAEG